MATVTSVTKHFATAKEGFTTTLASTISSGASTVPLNSVTGYSNGEVVALVIEPTDANKKQVFTGTVDTSGVQITGVVWTEGTNQTHTAGVTVVDYWTATHQAMMVKGVKTSLDDDGTLKAGAVDVTAVLADNIITEAKHTSGYLHGSDGYIDASETFVYVSASSFKITGTDVTAKFPAGTKIKLTQTTAKYFYVTSATFSTDTTVNVTGGTDYTLANAAITSPMYSYMETPQGFPQYFNYTPTWTNLTVGNGTVTALFSMRGKDVTFRVDLALGTTSSVAGAVSVSLPVTAATYAGAAFTPIGSARFEDTGTTNAFGTVLMSSTTTARVDALNASATYAGITGLSNLIPFTWGNTDQLKFQANYQAA